MFGGRAASHGFLGEGLDGPIGGTGLLSCSRRVERINGRHRSCFLGYRATASDAARKARTVATASRRYRHGAVCSFSTRGLRSVAEIQQAEDQVLSVFVLMAVLEGEDLEHDVGNQPTDAAVHSVIALKGRWAAWPKDFHPLLNREHCGHRSKRRASPRPVPLGPAVRLHPRGRGRASPGVRPGRRSEVPLRCWQLPPKEASRG